MTIKTAILRETNKKKEDYPVLMINEKTGTIILFTAETVGTVLDIGYSTVVTAGEYSTGWPKSNFKLFKGHIDLCNKSNL